MKSNRYSKCCTHNKQIKIISNLIGQYSKFKSHYTPT